MSVNQMNLESIDWVKKINHVDLHDIGEPLGEYKIITSRSVVRTNEEIHTIENMGYTVEAISQVGHYGVSLFVNKQ